MIAGAAFLAGAALPHASAQTIAASPIAGDDISLAVPRLALRPADNVALPQPLPPSEAARIRRVFALQRAGQLETAAREAALLDPALRVGDVALGRAMQGIILADRHLGPFTRPGAGELRAWLAQWPDLADAPAVHALLLNRLPRGAERPPAPVIIMLTAEPPAAVATAPVPEETEPAGQMPPRNAALDSAVVGAARSGAPGAVQRLLAGTRGLAPRYADLLRGEAARILFTLNQDEEAYALVCPAPHACRQPAFAAAVAGQAAGLAAWRMGRPELAMPLFEAAWRAELTTSAVRAAAAFWAARAHLRVGDPVGYGRWVLRAAGEPRTFYGMLARRRLGFDIAVAREARETLGEADIEAVAATAAGIRAFALLQVGQDRRAEAELRRLWPMAEDQPALGRAIMLVARQAGLVELAAQLADLVQSADGLPREAMRFPLPRLRPAGGFRVEPALIYGIARTESDFDAGLLSSAGALGLMQIMPDTASFITGQPDSPALRGQLRDPGVNLDLGQRYLEYLTGCEGIEGNLLRLLASYNSGPGSFAHWSAGLRDNGDPLLFIEAIGPEETRAFVPRALAYTWIYGARLHLPTPGLDDLAVGNWPRYRPVKSALEQSARLN